MHVDVDMSGRVEETNRPTTLALANGTTFSIAISARSKREVIARLKQKRPLWSKSQVHLRFFATLLFLLLKDHMEKLSLVLIDPEYPGHEADIKDWVMTLCRKHGISVFKDQLVFKRVGKKSPSHRLAIRVFRRKISPDREIAAREVLAIFGK